MVTEIFGFYWLYNKAYDIPIENKWQNQALTDLIQDIRLLQQQMIINLLKHYSIKKIEDLEQILEQWQEQTLSRIFEFGIVESRPPLGPF